MNEIIPEKKIKVLWLASWYPSRIYPFLGNFTRRWAMSDSLYNIVTTLALVEAGDNFGIEASKENDAFMEVRVYFAKSSNKLLKFFRLLKAGFEGYRYIQKERGVPDIIHLSVVYPAGIVALFISYLENIPLIVSEHWTGYKKEDGSFKGWFMKLLVRMISCRAKVIIALNPAMAKAMQNSGLNGNYHFIPNVAETSKLPVKTEVSTSGFRFIHVSGLDERQKNISGILEAIQILAQKRQDFMVSFVGGKEQVLYFEAMAESMDINRFAVFQGSKPHEDVLQEMVESDTIVLFSNFENLPCVILEGMAVGLPVIAAETGSMDEWIDEKTGILVKPGDVEGLVEAMNFMIDHSHEFEREKSKRLIRERCSPDVIGQAFSDIYEAVISAKKAG